MFGCEYCHRIDGSHHNQCPNYEPQQSSYSCSECNEPILIGEEYVVNDNGDYAHWECVDYARDLAKFLECEIKEMEDDNV